MNPIDAISMASRNCFDYYKMGNEFGGIGPGKIADILILDDYKKIKINKVILGGKIVVSNGKLVEQINTPKIPTWMQKTVKIPKLQPNFFNINSKNNSETVNTISMKTEIVTKKNTFDLAISTGCFHNLNIYDLKVSLNEIKRVSKQSYVMVESYRNEKELFNLQCWALTCESFFSKKEWTWLFKEYNYNYIDVHVSSKRISL